MKFFADATELDFAMVEYFLSEKISATTISFSGNAREGLQIMGLLETRMLDFKNVIVMTINEGTLPKGKAASSLLLYDIKRHFGLPTHPRTDAIYGYHFFRLLQRAENVYLIYDNESTDTLAEKSRFVAQLEFEIEKQQLQDSIRISHPQFKHSFTYPIVETTISVAKTKSIMEKLSQLPFSSSSLNAYIQCPLKFYWRYVEKIVESKSFDESNESAIIGNVIHGVLEEIFIKLKENPVQFSSFLAAFKDNIDEIVVRTFHKQPEIVHENLHEGKLYLACQIVKKSILDYIEVIHNEWQSNIYQIIGTEIPLVAELMVGETHIRLTGRADRIEIRDNKVTIFDYKTGKVEGKNLKCKAENLDDLFSDPNFAQLFQMLYYAYIYKSDKLNALVQTAEIQCGIITFQELYKQNEDYIYYAEIDKEKNLSKEILQLFEEKLMQLFSAIFNENNAFQQTEEAKNCKYCDYKTVCRK
jgi:CRISPR/Cas system-associated exonuclease Cas4 (RecB family)